MAVIKYQLLILFTVALAFRMHRHLGLGAAAAWTVWTLLKVHHLPLILIQTAVVWGTYLASRVYDQKKQTINEQDNEIVNLRNALKDHPDETRSRIESLSRQYMQFVSGRQHQVLLRDTIEQANSTVVILSGWISARVVDEDLLRLMWGAIQRGVQIHIGYGYTGFDGEHNESASAQKAIEKLGMLRSAAKRRRLEGGLVLGRFPTHEKIVIRDESQVICGSYNWLSTARFTNGERSVVIQDGSVGRAEAARVIRMIDQHGG